MGQSPKEAVLTQLGLSGALGAITFPGAFPG